MFTTTYSIGLTYTESLAFYCTCSTSSYPETVTVTVGKSFLSIGVKWNLFTVANAPIAILSTSLVISLSHGNYALYMPFLMLGID